MNATPLPVDEIVIVFADLQEGIVNVGVTNDVGRLRTSVAALADLATVFALPVIISCVPTTSGALAPTLRELADRFPGTAALARSTANPMDDAPFRLALEASERKTVIIAGVASEVVIRLVALGARRSGFRAIVAVDACSGLDPRTDAATFVHLSASGVELSSVATIAAELAGDFATESGRAAMRVLQSTLGLPAAEHPHQHRSSEDDLP
jgi:hypothetical protein